MKDEEKHKKQKKEEKETRKERANKYNYLRNSVMLRPGWCES